MREASRPAPGWACDPDMDELPIRTNAQPISRLLLRPVLSPVMRSPIRSKPAELLEPRWIVSPGSWEALAFNQHPPYQLGSTLRCQTGTLVHIHPASPENLRSIDNGLADEALEDALYDSLRGKFLGPEIPGHRPELATCLGRSRPVLRLPRRCPTNFVYDECHRGTELQAAPGGKGQGPFPQRRFVFHYTPTSCSWLNAVEGFFAKLTRRRLKRGVFRSMVELRAAINRFLAETNEAPKPFTWTADPDKIIAAVKRGHQALDSIH
jgi:hypothetical protein